MSIVVFIGPKPGGGSVAEVAALEARLNERAGITVESPFERAASDQLVGVLASPNSLSQLLLAVDEADGDWFVGAGIGELDPDPDAPARLRSGPAMRSARQAFERAPRSLCGVAVDGQSELCADVDASVTLLADLLGSRSERQRAVVTLRRRAGSTGEAIADELSITRRAVHKHLTAARFALEVVSCGLIDRVATRAASAI